MLYEQRVAKDGFSGHMSFVPKEPMAVDSVIEHVIDRPWDLLMGMHLENLVERDPRIVARILERDKRLGLEEGRICVPLLYFDENNLHPENEHGRAFLMLAHPGFRVRALTDPEYVPNFLINLGIREFNKLRNTGSMEGVDFDMITRAMTACRDFFPDEILRDYHAVQAPTLSGDQSYSTETSLRVAEVDETFERIRGFFSSIPETICFAGTHVTSYSEDFHLRAPFGIPMEIEGSLSVAGKGISERAAQVSAMMEFIERKSVYVGTEGWPNRYKNRVNVVKGKRSQLLEDGLNVFDPNDLNLACIYRDQESYWVNGTTASGKEVYLPAESVFMQLYLDAPSLVQGDSTGFASGNTLEEAKLHALFEILERDSRKSNVSFTTRRLIGGDNPRVIDECLTCYGESGTQLVLQENTSEFGIPSFLAVSDYTVPYYGAGCHLNAQLAAIRAIAELNMNLKHVSVWTGRHEFFGLLDCDLSQFPNLSTGNVVGDLRLVEGTLIGNGFEPIYFDLTHEEYDVPVVKAIVPGLGCWGPDAKYPRNFRHFFEQAVEHFR
jgi:ribosomal protein S12 methylthiotransferase accessory factor YcaO